MEIAIILFLILINGVLAMAEIAIVSSRPIRLQHMAEAGNKGAKAALYLTQQPNLFLSTVQVGITLVGILAGTFGGATVAESLAADLDQIEWLTDYSTTVAFIIVVSITTYLSLIIGELVPKRLGMQNPERLAAFLARPMLWLSVAAAPVVKFLSFSTTAILRLLRSDYEANPSVSEAEIMALIEQGTETGIFEKREQQIVERIFDMGDRYIVQVMTPRTEIIWLDVDASLDDLRATVAENLFSFYPVCVDTIDRVLGVVSAKHLLKHLLAQQPFELKSLAQQPIYVPETMPVANVLEKFKTSGIHIALVVGEHGGIEGLASMNDLLEEIVGDIDSSPLQASQREDGSWLIDGMYPIDDIPDLFPDFSIPEDDKGRYFTLAGFVLTRLGKIPEAADLFAWDGIEFEVVDMDGRRVDKVLVRQIIPPPESTISAEI